MKKTLFLLTLCSLLLAASCNTDDDATPDTSNDHDTLRCKINGQDWTPAGGDLFTTKPYDLQYYSDDGGLSLRAGNSTSNSVLNGGILMVVDSIKIGYNLLIDNESLFHVQNHNNNSDCELYEDLNSEFNNYLKVNNIDSINYFIIGEFQFSAINDCGDTIRVTDGYFDLDYRF